MAMNEKARAMEGLGGALGSCSRTEGIIKTAGCGDWSCLLVEKRTSPGEEVGLHSYLPR